MDTIRLYLHSMRMLIRSQLEYPASFVMQTLAQLVMEGGEMMAVILLVNRFERLNRWEAGDVRLWRVAQPRGCRETIESLARLQLFCMRDSLQARKRLPW